MCHGRGSKGTGSGGIVLRILTKSNKISPAHEAGLFVCVRGREERP